MSEKDDFALRLAGLRAGEPRDVRWFYESYGPVLERVAAAHLGERLRQRVGPEDIVQSACRTFLRRAKAGEFSLSEAGDLSRLVCTIALTKAREQARFHGRQRRNVGRESPLDGVPEAASEPSAEEAAAIGEALRAVLDGLDEESRTIVLLKMEDLTHDEVAARVGCSERTVRRLLTRVRADLVALLDPA